jgi:hypothetical protein
LSRTDGGKCLGIYRLANFSAKAISSGV